MKVHVAQEDIDAGEKGRASDCPIALALRRELSAGMVRVGYHVVSWNIGGSSFIADLSNSAKYFVRAFDRGRPVKPFAFVIEGSE